MFCISELAGRKYDKMAAKRNRRYRLRVRPRRRRGVGCHPRAFRRAQARGFGRRGLRARRRERCFGQSRGWQIERHDGPDDKLGVRLSGGFSERRACVECLQERSRMYHRIEAREYHELPLKAVSKLSAQNEKAR